MIMAQDIAMLLPIRLKCFKLVKLFSWVYWHFICPLVSLFAINKPEKCLFLYGNGESPDILQTFKVHKIQWLEKIFFEFCKKGFLSLNEMRLSKHNKCKHL